MTEKHSYELRVVDRQTRKVRVLLQNESFDYPLPIQWSADESVVLVWSKDLQGTGYIVLVDAASGQANTVRTIPQGEPSGLSLSPDHRFIAYDLPRSAAQRERTLHVLDVTSREDRTVVAAPGANDRFPLWTPDGGHLFFISDRSGSPDGWLLPLENGVPTGEPWLIVRNLGRVTSLGLTENGAFYYDLMAGVFEVREMALDEASTTSKAVATQFAGSNIAPSYSPDGEKLAYTSVREGLGGRPKRTITIKELKTGAERELSSRLLVTGVDRADRRATRILDAESGAILHEFNPQANRELGDYGPVRWTADGRGVLYEHVGSGLLMHPLDGGRDQMIYPYDSKSRFERIHRFEVSPDGSRLAISGFPKSNKGTALHIVAAGGEVELARRESPEMLVVQGWSADGTALYFTTLKPNGSMPQDLWRMSVTGDAPQHLGSLLSMTQINPIAIHPRGTTVAFTAGTPLRELWMMEHFLPQR
jgi:Tol biopolymer transport system component